MSITYHPHGVYDENLTLNVSEGNALIPAALMHADYNRGFILARAIDVALRALADANLNAFTRETVYSGNHINGGLTFERLEQYWSRLHDILRYCEKHNLALEWD